MRHLNEIVRERNQYSRSTFEAWQDYINLKARMDVEVSKLSKRNNFLVEEAESWRQQVRYFAFILGILLMCFQLLKVQSMWEQLNKEAQDLKVKIETHKRENRRLTSLIEQHKSDSARLTTRLQKSETLRGEAIDALMLQQELAETLEREREKNLKEISNLKQVNKKINREKEEAQRVVVHLRSLITGQTRHMEHIVGSLYSAPGSADYGEYDEPAEEGDDGRSVASDRSHTRSSQRLSTNRSTTNLRRLSRRPERSSFAVGSNGDGEKAADYESRYNLPKSKRLSESSLLDIADRHLRDKTDAIATIIRNISDQCTAAVEALQLARIADGDDLDSEDQLAAPHAFNTHSEANSDTGFDDASSAITANSKHSSIPPTPDLYRSSTAMSVNSFSTSNDRTSQQYTFHSSLQPKIVEGDETSDQGSIMGHADAMADQGKKVPERSLTNSTPSARVVS